MSKLATLTMLKYEATTDQVTKAHKDEFVRYKLEQIHEMWNKPQDPSALLRYSSLSYIELWEQTADDLTDIIRSTYHFCLAMPAFGRYYHKAEHSRVIPACLYDLIIIEMARLINLEKDVILYKDLLMPMSLVARHSDCHPMDLELINGTLEAAKTIAALELTDLENALYQCLVLSWPEREGLGDLKLLPAMHEMIIETIEIAVEKFHAPRDKEVLDTLMSLIPKLRDLGVMHIKALRRFEEAHPEHRFPNTCYQELFCNKDLYKELYQPTTREVPFGNRVIVVQVPYKPPESQKKSWWQK